MVRSKLTFLTSSPKGIVAVLSALTLLVGCGNVLLNMTAGSAGSINGASALSDGSSFASRCGFKASDLSRPGFLLVNAKYSSLPIVATGKQQGVNYKITFNADVSIRAPAGGDAVTETILKVAKNESEDNGRFTNAIAENQARQNSSRSTGQSLGTGALLALQETAEYKGILCSIGINASQRIETANEEAVIEYSPGLPGALNPHSTLQNFANELGDSRTFTTTVRMIRSAKNLAPQGSEIRVRTTFKKVSPKLSDTAGVPAGAPDVQANIAYEITTVGTGGEDVSLYKIDKRRVMFIKAADGSKGGATGQGEIVAVLSESGAIDKETGQAQPVVVIVKSGP